MAAFAALVALALSASAAPLLPRAPTWASASDATIHPGVNTNTAGSCTSNFVYYQGNDIYLGQAAHCSSEGGQTSTNGCDTQSMPEGSPVTITGASAPGTMVYNSWIRMQQRGETDPDTCAYNDLALVRIDPADHDKVNPSVPTFGGPTGLRTTPYASGETIFSYGNSILRAGIRTFSPKYGAVLQQTNSNWNIELATFTPGIPGDSGSGFFDGAGLASGVLSTLQFAPIPLANGVGYLANELAYAQTFGDFAGLQLALGTEPFSVALPELGLPTSSPVALS